MYQETNFTLHLKMDPWIAVICMLSLQQCLHHLMSQFLSLFEKHSRGTQARMYERILWKILGGAAVEFSWKTSEASEKLLKRIPGETHKQTLGDTPKGIGGSSESNPEKLLKKMLEGFLNWSHRKSSKISHVKYCINFRRNGNSWRNIRRNFWKNMWMNFRRNFRRNS